MHVETRMLERIKKHIVTPRKAILLSVVLVFGFLFAIGAEAQGLADISFSKLPEIIMGIIAMAFSALAWGIGKFIIVIISVLTSSVLQYNSFGSSNVVEVGWSLTRDIVNMFVIVVLLVIAIQTMVGSARAQWQQQLPRLFLAVVAINFSKTITLFVVDIGQVVMFTFVNALSEVAAGNFISLFNISSFYSVPDPTQAQLDATPGALELMATAWLTTSLLTMVLIILILMTIVFIYRIVVIWVLVILAPIAFFARGVGNTMPKLNEVWGQWWSTLSGAVSLGPILTFFLWLALAAASQGNISDTENFPVAPPDEAGGASTLNTEAFQDSQVVSLFVAMVLLVVGLQAASSAAGSLGGPAAQLLGKGGLGERLLKQTIAAPATAGYAAGRAGVRYGARGAKLAAGGAIQLAKSGGYEALRQGERRSAKYDPTGQGRGFGTRLTQSAIQSATRLRSGDTALGGAGRIIGGAALKVGGAVESRLAAQKKAELTSAKDQVAAKSDTQRMTEYAAAGDFQGTPPLRIGQRDERAQMAMKLATDKDEQKAFKKHLQGMKQFQKSDGEPNEEAVEEAYQKAIRGALDYTEKNKDALIGDDKKLKESFFKSKSANLHNIQGEEGKTHEIKDRNGNPITVSDREKQIRDHLNDGDFKASQLSAEAFALNDDGTPKDPELINALNDSIQDTFNDFRTGKPVTVTAMEQVLQGRKGVSTDVRQAASEMQNKLLSDTNRGTADSIRERLEGGGLKIDEITVENMNQNGDAVTQGLINANASGNSISGMDAGARDAFVERAEAMASADGVKPGEAEKIRQAIFAATGDTARLGAGAINDDGSMNAAGRNAVTNIVQSRPENIVNIKAQMMTGGGVANANDVTNQTVRSLSPDGIKEMMKRHASADEAGRAEIKDAIEMMEYAVEQESRRTGAGKIDDGQIKKLTREIEHAKLLT